MKCKVCGAYNEDYLEYCEKCASPLIADDEAEETVKASAEENEKNNAQEYQSYVAYTGETPPAWGFVKAPNWPKPDFDANTVSEDDIPSGYTPRFEPRPANTQKQHVVVNNEEDGFTNNVRMHGEESSSVKRSAVQPIRSREAAAAANTAAAIGTDESEGVSAVRTTKTKQTVNRVTKTPLKEEIESDDYDDDLDYGDDDFELKPSRRSGRKGAGSSGKKNIVFIAAAAVLVILIAVLGVIYVNNVHGGDFSKFISCTFSGDPITRTPTIEAWETDDGDPAYLITVYAKRNYTVRYSNDDVQLERTIGKNQRYIPFVVPQSILIPDEPMEVSEYTITPDYFTVISPSGVETKLEIDEQITIAIPSIDLNVTQPSVAEFSVDSAVVPIAGSVSDNTVGIFVNDSQIAIDEAGNFSTSYTLPGEGVTTIVVEARKNGYQTARAEFNVSYGTGSADPEQSTTGENDNNNTSNIGNVIFSVNSDVKRTGTASTMTVSGTMETGATISVSGVELDGTVTQDSNVGTFNFTVKTAKVGVYEAVITVTKGDAAKTLTLYLEHQPEKNAYMESVYKMDYDKIKNYPNHEQGYKIVGKVTEIIQSSPYVKAKIQTSDGDMIFYYYSGVAAIEVGDGKTYELYGDPYGTDSATGLPQLHAWFILKRS